MPRATSCAAITSPNRTSTSCGQRSHFTPRPASSQYMHSVVALVTAGVEMDVLASNHPSFTDSDRNAVVKAFPRTVHFKEDILQAFYDGIKHKPETTFGNVKADVNLHKDPGFHRGNFCSVIRNSSWRG